MKKLLWNGFYISAFVLANVAFMQGKVQVAIFSALLLILIVLDQIHDRLKDTGAHGIKVKK